MDESMSLLPDENPREDLELSRRYPQIVQPYGITAAMVGVSVLLIARVGFRYVPALLVWGIALVGTLLVYQMLLAAQPKLPLMALSVLAAELGLLLSLPSTLLFGIPWHHPNALVDSLRLVTYLIAAGVIGAFTGWTLSVERYPTLVLGINFLAMFVVVSLRYVIPLWLR